ncbi:hypothetical protein ABZ845_03790 [Streptomyces sp. NPDC047022]|uniref:hypothetical protein n=1 Tax=Streptomyces sp. NPDC047022 TaxID=3155737 RepID=UPI0033CB90FD
MHTGPFPTGPARALLGAGGVVVLTAAVSAALTRRTGDAGPLIRWLFGLGLTLCLLGGAGLLVHSIEVRRTSDGLHGAGRRIIDDALGVARDCDPASPRPTFFYPGGQTPGGTATYVPSPCSTSPRDALGNSPTAFTPAGYTAEEGDSFSLNGHVTVTEPDSGKQVCATVPDTVAGTGSVVDGPCKG